MIVTTWRGCEAASDALFWHVVPSSGLWAELFFNNVRALKGALFSVSVLNDAYRGTADARTGYGDKSRRDEKEQTFERIRRERFPDKPSRIDALFLFDDAALAEKAAARWFPNEARIIVEARVLDGANVHRGDANFLDLAEHRHQEECALAYWNGTLRDDPQPEVIVNGYVYFPQWAEFPSEAEVKAGKLRELVEKIEGELGATE